MSLISRRFAAACVAVTMAISPVAAQELEDLTLTAPAGAGGGWDSLARSLQETMMKIGTAKSVQVMNVPGAGGTVGLAQFSQSAAGSPNAAGRLSVNSPIAGVVTSVQVGPGGFVPQGGVIAEVTNPARVELVFNAPPHLAALVRAGSTLRA